MHVMWCVCEGRTCTLCMYDGVSAGASCDVLGVRCDSVSGAGGDVMK